MSVTESPLTKGAYDPVAWNFKLLAQHKLDGFGGMGEGMSIQIAPDGRRIIWLAHESAPKNFTAVDVSDPRKPKVVVQTDLPQAYMRSNSLEISRQHDGGRLSDVRRSGRSRRASSCSTSRCRRSRSRSPSVDCSGPYLARRAPALVRRRRIRPHGVRRRRLQAEPSARRPDLSLLRRAQSVEAHRGRPLVAARHAQGRQRAAARRAIRSRARQGQPRAQHQRLSAAAGPLLSRLHRRRHVRHGHLRQVAAEADLALGQLAAVSPASRTPSCRCSIAGCSS